jgi:4a-hydroxytetrahydrobiopterin dehydratase
MNELLAKKCAPCEGGVAALDATAAHHYLQQLSADWQLDADGKAIRHEYAFKNFYRTMSFVNAVAHIANTEDHHPDLQVGYNYCRIKFSTHAIDGLSENDFICAAKIDALPV